MRIVIAMVLGSAAVAAASPSQIVGKVIDSHGRPIEAATITLGTEHVTSTPAGVYRLVVPGPGTYKLGFDYADAHLDHRSPSMIRSRRSTRHYRSIANRRS